MAPHVTESLNAAFGVRFPASANQQKPMAQGIKSTWTSDDDAVAIPQVTPDVLQFGTSFDTSAELLERVQLALAGETGFLLDEGVVDGPEGADLCMIHEAAPGDTFERRGRPQGWQRCMMLE